MKWLQIKSSFFRYIFILLFLFFISLWPLSNFIQYRKVFITTSQGCTLSKGWNKNVQKEFTNTYGDASDEEVNLFYLNPHELDLMRTSGNVQKSELYKEATLRFIRSSSAEDLIGIALKKIISNVNPIPETSKKGFIEFVQIIYRIIYLMIIALFFIDGSLRRAQPICFRLIIIMFISQILMSVLIYTGLRFNSPYYLLISLIVIQTVEFYYYKIRRNINLSSILKA